MNLRSVFVVFVLIAGYRLRPANDSTTAASTSISAISDSVTGRDSSCADPKTAVSRCRTTAASPTDTGGRGDGACGGAVPGPSDRGDGDVSRSPSLHRHRTPPPIDRSPRLSNDSDVRRKWRRRRRPRADCTPPTAGHRRMTIGRQRPRTKLRTVENIVLYGLNAFFEKLELAVYLSLYKLYLLYTTFVEPLFS